MRIECAGLYFSRDHALIYPYGMHFNSGIACRGLTGILLSSCHNGLGIARLKLRQLNPGMDNLEEPVKTMRTTTINVPPNASIAKPRRQASFVLGGNNTSTLTSAAANNSPQSEARTGVSTGGSAGRLENDAASPEHQLDQLDRLQRTISPGSNPKGIDVQRLTPPPRADARSYPKVSPLPPPSDPEWTRRRTGVQPASFQEKQ